MHLQCFAPLVEHEKPNSLFSIPGESEEVYKCPGCRKVLKLGQMQCTCGKPIDWQNVRAWKRAQGKRRR